MKQIKRALSWLLAVTMLVTMVTISASAASAEQEIQAKALYELGLFKGYDDAGTNFGLDNQLTREAGIILLVRLLGEEDAAKAWTGPSPFTDVAEDSPVKCYLGYAKEQGYTNGIGGGKFGAGNKATMKHMVSYALRGLGYTDGGDTPDYTYAACLDKAVSVGLLDSNKEISNFDRGDAVEILFAALAVNVKNQEYDLLSKLMNGGVVSQAQYDKAMAVLEAPAEQPEEKPAEKPAPDWSAAEDPMPPEITKSPAWYMKLVKPQFKSNAVLVADYERLYAWMMLPDSKYTEPVMAREEEMRRELHGRAEILDDYVSYMFETQRVGNTAYTKELFREKAERAAASDLYKRATGSDLAPLKPYLYDQTIEYFGL